MCAYTRAWLNIQTPGLGVGRSGSGGCFLNRRRAASCLRHWVLDPSSLPWVPNPSSFPWVPNPSSVHFPRRSKCLVWRENRQTTRRHVLCGQDFPAMVAGSQCWIDLSTNGLLRRRCCIISQRSWMHGTPCQIQFVSILWRILRFPWGGTMACWKAYE